MTVFSSRFSWLIYIGFPISTIGLIFISLALFEKNPYLSILPLLGILATIADLFRYLTKLKASSDRVEFINTITGIVLNIPFSNTSNYRITKHANFKVTLTFATINGFESIRLNTKFYTNFNDLIQILNKKIGK